MAALNRESPTELCSRQWAGIGLGCEASAGSSGRSAARLRQLEVSETGATSLASEAVPHPQTCCFGPGQNRHTGRWASRQRACFSHPSNGAVSLWPPCTADSQNTNTRSYPQMGQPVVFHRSLMGLYPLDVSREQGWICLCEFKGTP